VARVQHDDDSELIHAQLVETDPGAVVFFDRSQPPSIQPDVTDKLYVVKEGDVLDNMATAEYGKPQIKWVIQWINEIRLEPVYLIPGTEIRLPTRERLRSLGLLR
jgi:hypothetical protein